MDNMNDSRSWAQGSKWKEWLWVMDDVNESRLWAQGSKWKEWLRVMDMENELKVDKKETRLEL